jgi:hypothetical protein
MTAFAVRRQPTKRRAASNKLVSATDIPNWFEEILCLYIPPGEHEADRHHVATAVAEMGLTKVRFAALMSQVWDDASCRVMDSMNAAENTSSQENLRRRRALSLAVKARDLADQMGRIMRASNPEDLALRNLLWGAFLIPIPDPREDGPGAVLKRPSLIDELKSFAVDIELSLKTRQRDEDGTLLDQKLETQAEILEAFQDEAFFGARNTKESIVYLLTDSSGRVRYSIWVKLLGIIRNHLKNRWTSSRDTRIPPHQIKALKKLNKNSRQLKTYAKSMLKKGSNGIHQSF